MLRQKYVVLLVILSSILLMGFGPIYTTDEVPQDVYQVLDTEFYQFVDEIFAEGSQDLFNFEVERGDISPGAIHPVHTILQDENFKPSIQFEGEWIVAIYQNGVARNALEIAKSPEGGFEIVRLGHYMELAQALDRRQPHEDYLYEPMSGFGYFLNEQKLTVSPIGEEMKQYIAERSEVISNFSTSAELSLEQFSEFLSYEYREAIPLHEDEEGAGGGPVQGNIFSSVPGNLYWWLVAFLGVAFGGFTFVRRYRFKA
ncbi:hypothetical protein [Bacillus horti]|uniref:SURF1-like protein n=1 Tax=Caldalkalibacillus horti TaxID=77523 RepID=A0ABT9W3X4_9BACI|nr:hypothetical protein [Bacillus horti]MDQ0167949.1 hypothetical protein [Bacillus horti]